MQVQLSKESDALLCTLYRVYLERRKRGDSIEKAICFKDDVYIQDTFFPKWPLNDVTTVCWWLCDKGLLSVSPGDDRANYVSLTEEGITYMDGRFKRNLPAVLDALEKLADVILHFC